MPNVQFDVAIIGAGIAGAAAAARLSNNANVLLLEAEDQPGYHATGRSAAFFTTTYGNELSRKIGRMSAEFFLNAGNDFVGIDLLHPRKSIFVANDEYLPELRNLEQTLGTDVRRVSAEEICAAVPILDSTQISAGLLDCTGGELDSDQLLQGFLRRFRKNGGEIRKQSKIVGIKRNGNAWTLSDSNGRSVSTRIVVNAAGAWVDTVAEYAGLESLGFKPLRRTALLVEPPTSVDVTDWPMIVQVGTGLYFKPDAGLLLVSPGDEEPTPPCDSLPDDLDVAIAVDRFETITTMDVRKVNHKWAGLRTFARDRNPVIGMDPRAEGFFWLAGLGGFGIATAFALAQLADNIINGVTPDSVFAPVISLKDDLDPARLMAEC